MRARSIGGILLGVVALFLGGWLIAAPAATPAPGVTAGVPPGLGLERVYSSKIGSYLAQPGRVVIRDVWDVGGFEARAWDAPAGDRGGRVHVHAVAAFEEAKPTEKVKGVMVVLSDPLEDRTFMFDAAQVPELVGAMESVRITSERLRNAPQDARRRAVYVVNGLEVARNADRAGGYLGLSGPDEITVRLNPDDFARLRELLERAQEILAAAK